MNNNHLAASSERDVRRALLEAMAVLRNANPGATTFEYGALMREAARILMSPQAAAAAAQSWTQEQNALHEPAPGRVNEQADNQKLLSALWRLVSDGLVFPRLTDKPHAGHYSTVIARVSLTEQGERLVDGGSAHPRHAQFVSAFRARTPTATDRIVAYVEDAVDCLTHGLLRPSLIMVGVANEDTVRAVCGALAHLGAFTPRSGSQKMRTILGDIVAAVPTWNAPSKKKSETDEQRHRLNAAVAFSEALRVERNNVAHPGSRAPDEMTIESHLVSFAAHGNTYWEIVVRHALEKGFTL